MHFIHHLTRPGHPRRHQHWRNADAADAAGLRGESPRDRDHRATDRHHLQAYSYSSIATRCGGARGGHARLRSPCLGQMIRQSVMGGSYPIVGDVAFGPLRGADLRPLCPPCAPACAIFLAVLLRATMVATSKAPDSGRAPACSGATPHLSGSPKRRNLDERLHGQSGRAADFCGHGIARALFAPAAGTDG